MENKKLGMAFKVARIEKEYTQAQLSELSGISTITIRTIEKGNINVLVKTLQDLASSLGKELNVELI